ncbi:uncharacterized protein BDZ83DRAFT_467258 [Colletotrichum acutatum]|uniref:Uncharacterized protein n=1 Tax=Glomerella acutata TaxID=27357 RepID=A0AAD8UGL5_GLOAC|nr:uncharacterized protein BDZ83DRAFT_467258 [Colletotrichum acutatum]KAK1718804.1 hypothetical protein BDZ83DRAFT_467258 [Colletotrichum acutatum]
MLCPPLLSSLASHSSLCLSSSYLPHPLRSRERPGTQRRGTLPERCSLLTHPDNPARLHVGFSPSVQVARPWSLSLTLSLSLLPCYAGCCAPPSILLHSFSLPPHPHRCSFSLSQVASYPPSTHMMYFQTACAIPASLPRTSCLLRPRILARRLYISSQSLIHVANGCQPERSPPLDTYIHSSSPRLATLGCITVPLDLSSRFHLLLSYL